MGVPGFAKSHLGSQHGASSPGRCPQLCLFLIVLPLSMVQARWSRLFPQATACYQSRSWDSEFYSRNHKNPGQGQTASNSSWRQTFDLRSCQPFVSSALPSTVMRKTKQIYSNKPLSSQTAAPSPLPPDPGLRTGLGYLPDPSPVLFMAAICMFGRLIESLHQIPTCSHLFHYALHKSAGAFLRQKSHLPTPLLKTR